MKKGKRAFSLFLVIENAARRQPGMNKEDTLAITENILDLGSRNERNIFLLKPPIHSFE